MSRSIAARARIALAALAGAVLLITAVAPIVTAQTAATEGGTGSATPPRVIIRFLTTNDFPPFNSADEDGVLTGLNVDLARAICLELKLTCDIRARHWPDLIPALQKREADAVIAAHRITAQALKSVAFTDRYFHTPARFAVRQDAPKFEATPAGLDGRRVAVVRGTGHEAYLVAFFRNTELVRFDTPELARAALAAGTVDAIFDDGIGLVFWVNGTVSKRCCALRGAPYFEPKFFGDGIAIAVRKTDHQMRQLLNQGLYRIYKSGRLTELVDRYFPIRVY